MFENIFNDILEAKRRQDKVNTFRATEVHSKVRKDNPTMLNYNRNLVDFSNPESVASMQSPILNPYGTNTYANPNIKYPTNNPTQYNPYIYNTYGYNSMDNLSAADTARFMIPKEGDKRIPRGRVGTGEKEARKPGKYDGLSYTELKLLPIPVRVVRDTSSVTKPRERQIRVEVNKPYHEPHTPFDVEELNPDYYTIKFFVDTPLNWTKKDAIDLVNICDKIYVYDKALAFATLEYIQEDEFKTTFTREKYEYMLQYLENKLKEYKEKEMKFRFIDYRAPYRYRPLPAYSYDDDGTLIVPMQIECVAKKSENPLTKDMEYDYDRGRDELTEEEWDIFKIQAFDDMMRGIKRLEAYDFCMLNKHMYADKLEENKPKEEELPPYNPNDPISVRLHQMKAAERDYNNNKEFFHHFLRHKMTDEEFDNWWYGTKTNPMNSQMAQEQAHNEWVKQMHIRHLQFLHTLQPINYAQEAARCRQIMAQRLREYENGLVRPDMSLAEYMEVLGYLAVTKPHELNLQRQLEESRMENKKYISQNQFQKARYHYFNNFPAKNPNPYYTPQYGTIDPRYNMPSYYVDYSNTPEARERLRITSEAVKNMGRHPRLHTLYK